MNHGQQELAKYILQLAMRTADGEIVWSQATPTTFVSTRKTKSGIKRMSIQRRGGPSSDDYLFQVKGSAGGGELALETTEKPNLRQTFVRLYAAAEASVDSQTLKILRDLLDD